MTSAPSLFVETNFLVGHARGEFSSYETIMCSAESRAISLIVPVFSIYEATGKIVREGKQRETWASEIDKLGKELQRKGLSLDRSTVLLSASDQLRALVDDHAREIRRTVERLQRCATLIDMTGALVGEALKFGDRLKHGDPWVCASLWQVCSQKQPDGFLTTDKNFGSQLEAFAKTPDDELLRPLAGLAVMPHPDRVVDQWSLHAF